MEHSQALGGLLKTQQQRLACHARSYQALSQGWHAQRTLARSHAAWKVLQLCFCVATLTAHFVGTMRCQASMLHILQRVFVRSCSP